MKLSEITDEKFRITGLSLKIMEIVSHTAGKYCIVRPVQSKGLSESLRVDTDKEVELVEPLPEDWAQVKLQQMQQEEEYITPWGTTVDTHIPAIEKACGDGGCMKGPCEGEEYDQQQAKLLQEKLDKMTDEEVEKWAEEQLKSIPTFGEVEKKMFDDMMQYNQAACHIDEKGEATHIDAHPHKLYINKKNIELTLANGEKEEHKVVTPEDVTKNFIKAMEEGRVKMPVEGSVYPDVEVYNSLEEILEDLQGAYDTGQGTPVYKKLQDTIAAGMIIQQKQDELDNPK